VGPRPTPAVYAEARRTSCSAQAQLPTSHELNVLQQTWQTIHTAANMYGQHLEESGSAHGHVTFP
jgi:hypothetical protein